MLFVVVFLPVEKILRVNNVWHVEWIGLFMSAENKVENSKLFDSVYSSRLMTAVRGWPERAPHVLMVALGILAGILSALSIGLVIAGGLSIFAGVGMTILVLAVFALVIWTLGAFGDVWIFEDVVTASVMIMFLAAAGTGGIMYVYLNSTPGLSS